jgi:glyoxylase-like metal-dependent hydrolase (beta-lactamase superfamily II)
MARARRFSLMLLFMVLASAGPAAAQENNRMFKLTDQLTLWVLVDSLRDMDLGDVFPGQDEVFKKYAPSGSTPSPILAFLLRSPEGAVLIDAGLGGGAVEKVLKEIGVAPEEISLVLLTHLHGDHLGGLMVDGRLIFPKAQIRLSREEHDFWLDEANVAEYPDRRGNFDLARQILPAYGDRVKPFEFGEKIALGLTALAALGHTPGHTVYFLEAEQMLFWGDLIHAAALQFTRPDISPRYDLDPEAAAATRLEFLELSVKDGLVVAGAHLPFPGLGRVTAAPGEASAFVFTPLE